MRLVFLTVVALGLCGCFDPASAQGSATGGADSSTTASDPGCPDGSAACPCYGNGTCDSGLECNATVALCVPENCDPGSENCTCNDGICLVGLECSAGVCVMPSGTTGVTSDPVTTDPVTTDPVTTDPATTDPATTDPATTDPATTDPATTDPATTDPTGVACDGDCPTCINCAVGDGGVCAEAYAACAQDKSCGALFAACNEAVDDSCATYCLDYAPDVVDLFVAVYTCLNDNAPCPGCALSC